MKQIHITLIRSLIDQTKRQKQTVKALGLSKLHSTVVHEETPQILGMVEKVKHLVKIDYK